MNRRAKPGRKLTRHEKSINRSRSRSRAFGEFPFHVVKRLWGFAKVRYRGIYKNTVRALAMFALSNLYLVRRRLLPPGASYTPVKTKMQDSSTETTQNERLGHVSQSLQHQNRA